MSNVWVANASPIIVLAKIGHLDLLTKLSLEVLLPQAVVDEIIAGPPADPARQLIEGRWGSRAAPQSISPDLIEWGLGPGETSVLALALERARAVLELAQRASEGTRLPDRRHGDSSRRRNCPGHPEHAHPE